MSLATWSPLDTPGRGIRNTCTVNDQSGASMEYQQPIRSPLEHEQPMACVDKEISHDSSSKDLLIHEEKAQYREYSCLGTFRARCKSTELFNL